MQLMNHRLRGFTLIEVTIVLAIMMVVAILVMSGMRATSQAKSRENYVAIQAREMALMQAAAKKYTAANDASFPAGTAVPVAVSTLITAGLLPSDFANRNGAVGTSPMFQPYLIVGRKDATTSKIATVVAESSTPLGSRLQQMGLVANDAMVFAFKQQVAEEANKTFKVVAGTVDKNSTVAKGVFGGFTKDLAAYIGSATAAADAVVLQGFADLEPPGGDPNGDGRWQSCIFNQTSYSYYASKYVLPTCPAGYTELARTPFCNFHATSLVYPSDVGSLYLSSRTQRGQTRLIYDWSCYKNADVNCRSPQPYYTDKQWSNTWVDVLLNGAVIATDPPTGMCDWNSWAQGSITPYGCQVNSSPDPGVDRPCPINQGDPYGSTGNHARFDIGQDPYDVLCCLPK